MTQAGFTGARGTGRKTERPNATDAVLQQRLASFQAARQCQLGYPFNLAFEADAVAGFGGLLINNLGDPYVGSHFPIEVCDLEREVVAWFMDLWECGDPDPFWGSVGASGTDGNLWALYLAREALPDAPLLHSDQAHYSIPKAARILRMPTIVVPSLESGAMATEALADILGRMQPRQVVAALTCGTTMKAAHDDVAAAAAALQQAGYGPDRRFIHLDGAFNGMVLPFLDGVPEGIRPSFGLPIDSLCTSGHKMIGTPMPCGVLIARRRYVDAVASSISYLRSNDTTLMGSRNGHAVLALWSRLMRHGRDGFAADVRSCVARARDLAGRLEAEGVPVLLNPHGMTVVFPEPAAAIVQAFQLACEKGIAHAVVMPNVSDQLLDRFLEAYLAWWRSQAPSPRP